MGTDDPVNTIPIGEGQGGKTEALGLFHKLIGMARPFEERTPPRLFKPACRTPDPSDDRFKRTTDRWLTSPL